MIPRGIILFLALLATSASAPEPLPGLVLYYELRVPEPVIQANLAAAETYAGVFAHGGDEYMAGYFAGRAAVWRELQAQIDAVKPQPRREE